MVKEKKCKIPHFYLHYEYNSVQSMWVHRQEWEGKMGKWILFWQYNFLFKTREKKNQQSPIVKSQCDMKISVCF